MTTTRRHCGGREPFISEIPMAKKLTFQFEPVIVMTSERNLRLISPWQVESWLTGQANDCDMDTPEGKVRFKTIVGLKEQFAKEAKADVQKLLDFHNDQEV